jgi:hypothetical protein
VLFPLEKSSHSSLLISEGQLQFLRLFCDSIELLETAAESLCMTRAHFLLLLAFFSRILSSQYTPLDMEGVNARAGKLVNGVLVAEADDRDYLATTLPNGLKALLISDPSTEMAAAAIGCEVGSLDDDEDLPGQAHFTEHLLFMGSTAFPDENEYSSFLSDHGEEIIHQPQFLQVSCDAGTLHGAGGSSNAYTASDLTNYHFEVAPEHLSATLDRFAGFFTGVSDGIFPLFD